MLLCTDRERVHFSLYEWAFGLVLELSVMIDAYKESSLRRSVDPIMLIQKFKMYTTFILLV